MGQGPEEYHYMIGGITYNERKDELYMGQRNSIKVYSSQGEYKRTLTLPTDALINRIYCFGEDALLIEDSGEAIRRTAPKMQELTGMNYSTIASSAGDGYTTRFVCISSVDGQLIESIPVPENYDLMLGDFTDMGGRKQFLAIRSQRIVPYREGFLLYNQETDTTFYYDKNFALTPEWIQHPSVEANSPNLCMNVFVENSNWQFFEKIIVKINPDMPPPFIIQPLMRDKKSGEIYTQKIIWDEYKGKNITLTAGNISRAPGGKMALIELPLFELQDAHEEGRLGGDLKKLFTSMNEEENELYLLLRFK